MSQKNAKSDTNDEIAAKIKAKVISELETCGIAVEPLMQAIDRYSLTFALWTSVSRVLSERGTTYEGIDQKTGCQMIRQRPEFRQYAALATELRGLEKTIGLQNIASQIGANSQHSDFDDFINS